MLRRIRHRCRPFANAEQGSVFVLLAVSAFMLITAAGVAVDMARAQILQQKISTALDAAGLAAGATASTINVQTQAQKYFNANFPSGYLGAGTVTVVATLSTDKSTVSLTATTTQPTSLLKAVGINSVNVGATSQITRQSEGMELVLVMDNTGSMNSAVNPSNSSTPKIQAAQTAAAELVNILYGDNTTVPNLWVGLVPFSQAVNIGTVHSSWMSSSQNASLDFGPTAISSNTCTAYSGTTGSYSSRSGTCNYTFPGTKTPSFGLTNWTGCVMSRSPTSPSSMPYDVSDTPPTAGTDATLFQAYDYPPSGDNSNWYTSNTTTNRGGVTTTTTTYSSMPLNNNTQGPNYLCPQQITQMTASKTTILSGISSMSAGGSTAIDLGMAWGYRMLSPNWTGLWGGEMNSASPQLPLPYNTALMQKVLILMTDGMNEFDSGNYMAYGFLSSGNLGTTRSIYSGNSYSGSAEQVLDTPTLDVCTALKNNGVIIYTIGFGQNGNDDSSDQYSVNGPLLQSCASQPSYYFLAPTNAQLETVFQQIGDSLANLRVSK